MLKQRVVTALVLIPFVVLSIFYLPSEAFSQVLTVIILIAAWEWANLIGIESKPGRAAYLLLVLLVIQLLALVNTSWLYSLVTVAWGLALFWVLTYPESIKQWSNGLWLQVLIGLIVLVPTWGSLTLIQAMDHGPWWIMFLMGIVWGADTGAYFVGRRFGKHKLAPVISPGKSIEGAAGGLLVTTGLAVLLFMFDIIANIGLVQLMTFTLLVALASILGDLFESMMKRYRGIKDSGQILPGHGGLLDRIDSLTAAGPFFVFGLFVLDFIQ